MYLLYNDIYYHSFVYLLLPNVIIIIFLISLFLYSFRLCHSNHLYSICCNSMSRCIIHCFHHVQAIGKPPLNWSRTSLPSWIDEWTDEWMYLFVTLTWVKYFQPFTPFIGIAHEQRSWQALRANINNVFPSKQLPINQEHEVGDSRYQWCNPITIEPMLSASASFLYWLTTSSIIKPTITPLITARNQL